jgi:hypothetical protein
MFIFPLLYLASFLLAITGIIKGNRQEVLLYLIFGLPIYITALAITFDLGFGEIIGALQAFKEIIILTLLSIQIWMRKTPVQLHVIDYIVIAFFIYTVLYVLLPIGEYGFLVRLIAFKGTSFFVLIYFAGRLFDPATIYINKYFHYILYVSIAAALLAVYEYINGQHFQTRIGYADFYYYVFNLESSGNYGLSWTFETQTGLKRFASFFANPIEHSAATLLALSVIAALFTTDNNKFKLDRFGIIALIATQASIILAVSRASFLSYFLMIYVYALVTRRKEILYFIHFCVISGILYFLFLLRNEDIQDFVTNTLQFTDSSSIGHVLEWINGINAMIQQPLGLGLGTSGRIGSSMQGNTGGENQFIIFGVQLGIIAMLLYMSIYFLLVKTTLKWFYKLEGKEKKVCLALLLMKIGFIIPFLTSELESSSYISYMTWFLSGLFINMIVSHKDRSDKPSLKVLPEVY